MTYLDYLSIPAATGGTTSAVCFGIGRIMARLNPQGMHRDKARASVEPVTDSAGEATEGTVSTTLESAAGATAQNSIDPAILAFVRAVARVAVARDWARAVAALKSQITANTEQDGQP